MDKTKLTKEQRDILELSSILENAPYLLHDAEDLNFVGRGNSGTCQCASSRSAGGTCRAVSSELAVSE